MARNTGSVCRLCRRLGDKLYLKGEKCFTPKCPFERRPYPPGQRTMRRRRRVSDRGLQLREKQRARAVYGILEKQFRRYYAEAVRRHGVSGDNLLRILELRLDNILYRLGFAESRSQGRQIALHGHVTVNGRKARTPSHVLKQGDVVAWTSRGERSGHFQIIKETLSSKSQPSWLSVDPDNMTGRVLTQPETEEIGAKFSPATVVEYYSR